jgi:putative tricarboxylic transport membrane protein
MSVGTKKALYENQLPVIRVWYSFEVQMRVTSLITSLFLVSFSILIFIMSIDLGIGSLKTPGPGFLGFLGSISLFILSSIIFFLDIKKPDEEYEEPVTRQKLKKPILLALSLFGFTLLLDILGFLISASLLMWAILLINTPDKWFRQLVIALIMVNVAYFILCKLLGVILPSGIFRLQW